MDQPITHHAVIKNEILDNDCDYHYGDLTGRNNCEEEIVVDTYEVDMPETDENSMSTSIGNHRSLQTFANFNIKNEVIKNEHIITDIKQEISNYSNHPIIVQSITEEMEVENTTYTSTRNNGNSETYAVGFKEEPIDYNYERCSEGFIKAEDYKSLHSAIDIKDEIFSDSEIMTNSDSESCTKIHLKEEFQESDLKTWNSSIDIDLEKSSDSNDHTRKIHCDGGSALKNELLSDSAEKSFHCEYCERRFAVKRYLRAHLLTHTGEKPFHCEYCERRFAVKRYLRTHLLTHTGEKPFKCDKCEKSFKKRDSLRTHLRTHTGEKPFNCDYCGNKFDRKTTLQRHLLTHTGEKQFGCDICEKRFIRRDDLRMHLRTHTGEKPFNCDHCGKKFARKSTLQGHILTHTGEKPFNCDYCGNKFALKVNLQRHILTHTGEKPFNCDYCGNKFALKITLQRHILTHTGKSIQM